MNAVLRCSGCETGYDVGGREPGQRVRCPRCQTVLVVPEPAGGDAVTESAVLRRTRGAPCATHPRGVGRLRCSRCASWACGVCTAPAPIDHLCVACAEAQGLGGALAVDLGLLETPRLAARLFAAQGWAILAWAVLAWGIGALIWALPAAAGVALVARAGLESVAGSAGLGLAAVAVAGFLVLTELLLIPAGTAVLIDDAIRGRPAPIGAGLRRAWHRVVRNLGALLGVFAFYLLLAVLAVVPALPLGAWLAERTGAWTAAALPPAVALIVAGVLLIPAVGLAVPVVVLEERGAFDALGRAWRLGRLRYGTLVVLTGVFACAYGGALALGALGPGVTGVVSRVLDLVAPALLVTAYHGVAAEDAGVLGRGS